MTTRWKLSVFIVITVAGILASRQTRAEYCIWYLSLQKSVRQKLQMLSAASLSKVQFIS